MATVRSICFPYALGQERSVVFGNRSEQLGPKAVVDGHFRPKPPKFERGFHVCLPDFALGKLDIAFTTLGKELTRFDNVLAIFATGIGMQIFTDQIQWGLLRTNGREYLFKARPHETHWVVQFYTGGKLVAEASVKKPAD